MNYMKRIFLITPILCVCLVFAYAIINKTDWFGVPKASYIIPRHIEYSFTLQNKTNRLVKKAEFWTYAPVKQTATQRCDRVEASHPFRMISDELGNQILHFTLHDLSPYATKIITIKADLMLSDMPNQVPIKDPSRYLVAEPYCESDNPAIARIAATLEEPESIKTAEKIFQWVAGNVEYAGYLKNARGALYALKNKKGDCTEFMYLFAALCRANNIPARGIGGYVLERNAILKASDYHNWAEFYDGGTWQVADPQNKVFMKNPSHYIAMRRIGDAIASPMGGHSRFRYVGDGLKVRINR